MHKTSVILAMLLLAGSVSAAQTCDVPGSGCNEQDWGSPNCAGNYGGFDGVGCANVAMVVAPGNCDGSDTWASVDMSGGTVKIVVTTASPYGQYCPGYGHLAINWIKNEDGKIKVRYLDGMDDDSFDVQYKGEFLCHVTGSASTETWKTAECVIPEEPTPAPESAILVGLIALIVPGLAYYGLKK
ncbi:hypothetical protein ACFLRF_00540 [Candidatus Altiarchaeota archaeon]